ncbi:type II toxin-antitoxin system RelE/ParE family toxin [Pseudochelatococcus sp. B33]
MHRLVFRPAALSDLDAIFDYIEPDNPLRAASFVADIRTRCRLLCDHPMLGPARNDLGEGLRIYPMFRRIVVAYRFTGDAIVIVRVFSGGQDYEAILQDTEAHDWPPPEIL